MSLTRKQRGRLDRAIADVIWAAHAVTESGGCQSKEIVLDDKRKKLIETVERIVTENRGDAISLVLG